MDDDKRKLGVGVNVQSGPVDPAAGIVVVYTTFPDFEAAAVEGERMVEAGLAACVNILPGMTSIYVWEGQLHRDGEVMMVVKTRAALADAVIAGIKSRHSYSNPAIVVLPVIGGSPEYLDWVRQNTSENTKAPRS